MAPTHMPHRYRLSGKERAAVSEEVLSTLNEDQESYDGRRRMTERGEVVHRKMRVLSQFTYSRLIAERTSFDVRIRVYRRDEERMVRMERPVNVEEWVRRAAAAFSFESCHLRDPDSGHMLMSDAAVKLLLHDFAQLELTRKLDVLTVWSERALSRLIDDRHEAEQERGAHELWELACRAENHAVICEFKEMFSALLALVNRDGTFVVRATAAAAVATLAEQPLTMDKMPVAELCTALLASAARPENSGEDGEKVVWIIAALSRLAESEAGRAALVNGGGVRSCLALLRAPQPEARRAAVVLVSSFLSSGEVAGRGRSVPGVSSGRGAEGAPGCSAAEIVQFGAPDLVGLAAGAEDAVTVRTMALYVVSHAVRQAAFAGLSGTAADAMRELLPTLAPALVPIVLVGRAELEDAAEKAVVETGLEQPAQAEHHAEWLTEGAVGALWSIAACLAVLGAPLTPDRKCMEAVMPSTLAPIGRAIPIAAAGLLSVVAPDEALVDVDGGGSVSPRLLTLLEHLVQRTKLGRRHELLGACVANWVALPSEHNALLASGGLSRVLAVCTELERRAKDSGASLRGLALALHTSLAYIASQLSAGDAVQNTKLTASVTEEDVRQAISLLQATRASAVFGTTILFGFARGGLDAVRLVGSGGGVEALQVVFRRAIDSGRAVGSCTEHTVAHFSAAALWMLVYDEANATRLTRAGSDVMLAVSKGHLPASPVVQTMCIGIVSKLMRVHYLTQSLMEEGAAVTLANIGRDAHANGTQRTLAASALNEVAKRDEFRGELADMTDSVMVTLVNARGKEGKEEMQLIACRALARTAFGSRKRRLLDMGGTRELLAVVKSPGASVELRELALNALLNLSGDDKNQVYIAKHAIFHLVAILYAPPSEACAHHVSGVLCNLALNSANRSLMYRAELQLKHAQWAGLDSIDPESAAEGRPRAKRQGTPGPAPVHGPSPGPRPPSLENLAGVDGEGQGATASASVAAAAGGGEAQAGPGRSATEVKRKAFATGTKERYLVWVDTVLGEDMDALRVSSKGHSSKKVPSSPTRGLSPSSPTRGLSPSSPTRGLSPSSPTRGLPPSDEYWDEKDTPPRGGRRAVDGQLLSHDKSLPQLMCRPFHESWKLPGTEEAPALASSGSISGSASPLPQLGSSFSQGSVGFQGAGAGGGTGTGGEVVAAARNGYPAVEHRAPGGSERRGSACRQPLAPIGMTAAMAGPEAEAEVAPTDLSDAAATVQAGPDTADPEGLPQDPGEQPPRPPTGDADKADFTSVPGDAVAWATSDEQAGRARSPEPRLLGFDEGQELDIPTPHERWFPPVVDVSMQKKQAPQPSKGEGAAAKARPHRIKGKVERPFVIKLDPNREYTSTFKFNPVGQAGAQGPVPGPDDPFPPLDADGSRASMVAWKGRRGCRYSQGLFAQIPLPDGNFAHVYHLGHKKNSVDPGAAPEPPMPSDLTSDFSIAGLPVKPPAPLPGRKDPPATKLQMSLSAPVPEWHQLPVEDETVWYGTVPNMAPLMDAEERTVVNVSLEEEKKAEALPTWTLDDSVFAPRKKYSDSRSYWNTAKTSARAFEIDWSRLNQERFRVLIEKEDDSGGDEEMIEIKDVLKRHRDLMYSAFTWYSTIHRAMDGYVIKENGWAQFCADCKLPDKESQFCKMQDLDKLFILQNVEENEDYAEETNKLNPNRALLRFEFFQIIVRVAIEKFVRPGIKRDVSEALEKLIVEYIAPNMPPEAKVDTDVFRNHKLYFKEVDDVFRRYLKSLKNIYSHFAATIDDIGQRNEVMSSDEFVNFLNKCRLIDDGFRQRHARLCFVWSQTFVTDEVRRREKMISARFPDFLEAIARITLFKAFPTEDDILRQGCKDCAEYWDSLLLAQPGGTTANDFLKNNRVDWTVEQEDGRKLEEVLEMLLSTVVKRLDTDLNGIVEGKDFTLAAKHN